MNEQRCHDIDSYFLPGKWGYHRQGSCQAGLGASVADNGEQLFIGAVGSWYWQGKKEKPDLILNLAK